MLLSKRFSYCLAAFFAISFALFVGASRISAQDAREFLLSDELIDDFYAENVVDVFQFSDDNRELELPFASKITANRACFDSPLSIDCSRFARFELVLELDNPKAMGNVTLYFHSQSGWYNYTVSTARQIKSKFILSFDATKAFIEEHPVGLDKIDAIRIAFWRSNSVDGKVVFQSLRAVCDSYALLDVESDREESERLVFNLKTILERSRIRPRILDAKETTLDILRDYPAVFVPLSGEMPDETTDLLCDYIDAGGRVFAFYCASEKLLRKIGVELGSYVNCERANLDLQSMVFTEEFRAKSFQKGFEIPNILKQHSWNFFKVKPISDSDAIVAAYWGLKDAEPTEYPALIFSSKGGYCSHILLQNDVAAENALMRAFIGYTDRRIMLKTAQSQWASLFYIGLEPNVDEAVPREERLNWIESSLVQTGWTLEDVANALRVDSDVQGSKIVQLTQILDKLVAEQRQKYFASVPSREVEGRLWWEHSGMGIYPGDWDRTMKELSEAGFNAVVPNLLWGGCAYYKSDVLPNAPLVEQYGDQVEQAVAAGKKYGIEVHAWMVCFNASNSPEWFLDQMRKEGRLQKTRDGEETQWLCPSDPRNRALQLAALEEVATKYDVDGVHFDYIRFPNDWTCFCDGCKERFAQAYREKTGEEIGEFPKCALQEGSVKKAFKEWRCEQINALVRETHNLLKEKRPEIKLSAAVFENYPTVKYSIGQDWGKWIDEGWLDFICPMDYTTNDTAFINDVVSQLQYTKGKVPLYPGIGMTATGISMDPEQVVRQVELARQSGAQGFTIFNLAKRTADKALPALKAGATSQKAKAPHSASEK